MVVLQLHFQVTVHKQPVLAVDTYGDVLATAEQGAIRLWSLDSSRGEAEGPALLQAFQCSRQPVRALFILPECDGRRGCLGVVGVFEEEVVLFDVWAGGVVERHVLLHRGDNTENKIQTAAWNADTFSLAVATEGGGVEIYDFVPSGNPVSSINKRKSDTPNKVATGVGKDGIAESDPVKTISASIPQLPQPVKVILRQKIVIKIMPSTSDDSRRADSRPVSSLATSSIQYSRETQGNGDHEGEGRHDDPAVIAAGAGILVGVAEDIHLCIWDLATGSTLLTALSIAPSGYKVEKVVWYGPTALVALLYHDGVGVMRVDVHQVDIAREATTSLFSYTSDVTIAGADFSAGPPDRLMDLELPRRPSAATNIATARTPTGHYQHASDLSTLTGNNCSTYLHVIDRLRTLRTWLLHRDGATPVAAYSLPPPAPRVPKNVIPATVSKNNAQKHQQDPLGGYDLGIDITSPTGVVEPESSLSPISVSVLSHSRGERDDGASGEGEQRQTDIRGRKQRQRLKQSPPVVDRARNERREDEDDDQDDDNDDEEEVGDRTFPAGALAAMVLPSRFQGPNSSGGPGILVTAGVALSGVSFIPEDPGGGNSQSLLIWESRTEDARFDNGNGPFRRDREDVGDGPMRRRVLGMRGLFPRSGSQQALAIVWAESPSFQMLDVSRIGCAGIVEEVHLARRHREDQLATAPRLDRPCFPTSWCHSTTLGILLCGWNDGVVDVINPRTASVSCRLERKQEQLLPRGRTCVPTTAVGLIPLSLLFRHTGNQFFSDEPRQAFPSRDGTCGVGGAVAVVGCADGTLGLWPTDSASCRPWKVVLAHSDAVIAIRTAMDAPQHALERLFGVATNVALGDRNGISDHGEESSFFVVTAGANREVKVWGLDTADGQDIPPLTLAGYTVVGRGGSTGGLTALELLSERHMACGFETGDVEVWSIPFPSRGGILASTREAVQAFPLAHGAKVTSISVSIGVGCRIQGSGGVKVGRVVLTTSTDLTVLRWVSIAPGDSIQPLRRYCLSEHPAAAVLLPPPVVVPATATNGRHGGGSFPPRAVPNINDEVTDSGTAKTTTTMAPKLFRVVVALNGVVTVLEFATAETLIGKDSVGGKKQSRRPCPAVANSFPGIPFAPQLPLRPAVCGSSLKEITAQGASSSCWRVGGPRGHEAGRYTVSGGITWPLLGWETSGKKRMALTDPVRKEWNVRCTEEAETRVGPRGTGRKLSRPGHSDGGGDTQTFDRLPTSSKSELRPESVKGERSKFPRGGTVTGPGNPPSQRRPTTVSTGVKTLTFPAHFPGTMNSNKAHEEHCEIDRAMGHAYRTTSSGKTIKLDPRYAAANAGATAWDFFSHRKRPNQGEPMNRLLSPAHGGDDHNYRNEQPNVSMYSMELVVPNLSERPSAVPLRSGADDISMIATSFQRTITDSLNDGDGDGNSSRFQGCPTLQPAVEGGAPSYKSGESASSTESRLGLSALELAERYQHSIKTIATASDTSMVGWARPIPIENPTTLQRHPDNGSPGGGVVLPFSLGNHAAGGGDRVIQSEQAEDPLCVHSDNISKVKNPETLDKAVHNSENGSKKGPMNAVVAAATAARRARESGDARGRRTKPVVLERRPPSVVHEPRVFNVDLAQAPSSGMLGVGVAVPIGFSDKRLWAAKRCFTPSVPPVKVARRKRKGECTYRGGTSSGARGTVEGEGAEEPNESEATGIVAEVFPTGLVVSRHFRESFSGREILMLEVEKAADRRDIYSRHTSGRPSTSNSGRTGVATAADAAAAAAAAASELALLSPRSKMLHEVFTSLAAGRDILTQDGLMKWEYVSQSMERGLVSQYQVKSLFKQAHGGRHRGKIVWRDMIAFYEGMESALDKACAPPLVEEFVIDAEDWDSVSASLYLTKRGEVYVIALEVGPLGDGANDGRNDAPPSPATMRRGRYGETNTTPDSRDECPRVIAAWAMATVPNPDVPARVVLDGLLPERDYELYAYGENGVGGRSGRRGNDSVGENGTASVFSVEPAPSGMSLELVADTRLLARTAREPDEELDVPWKDLSEPEQVAEVLAALADPLVARAAREAALDLPTAEDLVPGRCDTNPLSRNRWRSFCRWWTTAVGGKGGGGVGGTERSAFLLRECIFAAQQPEVVEEAAMMGVQIIEGDWNAEVAGAQSRENAFTSTQNLSARQRRWTAFRSWYRGGRVFDRADESLIAAVMLRRPSSPASLRRPVTPRMTPADGPQSTAPTVTKGEEGRANVSTADAKNVHSTEATGDVLAGNEVDLMMLTGGMLRGRRTTPPQPPAPPATVTRGVTASSHVTLIELDKLLPVDAPNSDGSLAVAPTAGANRQEKDACLPGEEKNGPRYERGTDHIADTSRLSSIPAWDTEEREEEGGKGSTVLLHRDQSISVKLGHEEDDGGRSALDSEVIADGLSQLSRKGKTAVAIKRRMEARRKFLAARTFKSKEAAVKVTRLLDVKREDVKAKRTAEASSGVVARRGRAAAAAKKRRRSQVERALAIKRADELLEESGKAEEIGRRRGSLGTLRPEDVASIGVFDTFNVDEFDPEEADPELFRRPSVTAEVDNGPSDLEKESMMWAPRSPDELTLELQLACVQPVVCTLAASAGVGVPDPEDAFSPLQNKKVRWAKFSAWYCEPEAKIIAPQRKAFLDGEVLAAVTDETIRRGMQQEGMLDDEQSPSGPAGFGCCDVSDFLEWYCEDDARPRREFRHRRLEELLQSRRYAATQLLAYVPMPFLFRDLPRSISPPLPPVVERFRLFPSRTPEVFSWEDVSSWYGAEVLEEDDEVLCAGERAGQRAALLEMARAEEGNNQCLERRVVLWEDLRSELMRAAAEELKNDPFQVGKGEWQYSATLLSWRELRYLGFDTGSGLENKDEVHDALEVARKEAQDERERIAEVRRQREIVRQKRLEEERRRKEEEERLRWMRETEERRRLVQQHMVNLKRQRALEAERARMAKEEELTLFFMREESRLQKEKEEAEVAEANKLRMLDMAAVAVKEMDEMVKKRLRAEMDTMVLEDRRSQEVEDARRRAEAALRDKEAFLRHLYTPFVPMWERLWDEGSRSELDIPTIAKLSGDGVVARKVQEWVPTEENECCSKLHVDGKGDNDMSDKDQGQGRYNVDSNYIDENNVNDRQQRPTMWWRGADAPHIWKGPKSPEVRARRCTPGARFVPAERALLDGLEPQAMSVGRLSKEYLALLGLPHESIRDMYQKDSWTVKNGDAMVDDIQLGRVFTMFEKDEVRNNLIPIVSTAEHLRRPTQHSSRGATTGAGGERKGKQGSRSSLPLDGPIPRRLISTATSTSLETTSRQRVHGSVVMNDSPSYPQRRRGNPLCGKAEEEEGIEQKWRNNSNYCYHPPAKNSSQTNRGIGVRNAKPRAPGVRSVGGSGVRWGVAVASRRGDVWPGQGWGQQVVRPGVEEIAGLPLTGEERNEVVLKTAMDEGEMPYRRMWEQQQPAADVIPKPSSGLAGNHESETQRRPPSDTVLSRLYHDVGQAASSFAPSDTVHMIVQETLEREKIGETTIKQKEREKAFPPPLLPSAAPAAPAASEVRLAGPQQEGFPIPHSHHSHPSSHQQWGGFGPGHIPKYFRGKFGVAGERKRLIRRLNGDVDHLGGDAAKH